MTAKETSWAQMISGIVLTAILGVVVRVNFKIDQFLEEQAALKTTVQINQAYNDSKNKEQDEHLTKLDNYFFLKPDEIKLKRQR